MTGQIKGSYIPRASHPNTRAMLAERSRLRFHEPQGHSMALMAVKATLGYVNETMENRHLLGRLAQMWGCYVPCHACEGVAKGKKPPFSSKVIHRSPTPYMDLV